jgi:hypothetical protein
MKTFDFHLDQKVTTWMRTEFEIKANSLKEAIEIAKEKFDNGDLDDISWEEIDGLNEVLQPSDNGNQPTAEIYYMNEVGDVQEVFNNSGNFNPKEANYW